jgi:hypothetical protein
MRFGSQHGSVGARPTRYETKLNKAIGKPLEEGDLLRTSYVRTATVVVTVGLRRLLNPQLYLAGGGQRRSQYRRPSLYSSYTFT